MRTLIKDIPAASGTLELKGFVHARRDHGKLIFIDLRDRSGIVQLVFLPQEKEAYALAEKLRPEWVIEVHGTIQKRPKGMENDALPTGTIEIAVKKLEVLTEAETPVFDVTTDGREVSEEVRMENRYIDLRRERMQKNLRMRHKIIQYFRNFLSERDFTEVETPILGKSTPEGARDYLVPARLHPGTFYALPQSPQQYKQLLMVAGLERYFQIARCFRDEDTRGDRQPEFTQLDIEMSFTNPEEIMELIQEMYIFVVQELFPEFHVSQKPFPRLTYHDVMKTYTSDKPDLRKNKEDSQELAFAFVVDFPMFEWKEQEKRWDAVHHPFTMPKVKDTKDFKERFKKDPSTILAFQYDLVLNGYEIGGGSIRIHNRELLLSVFEAMGNKRSAIESQFGHMLKAFASGVPPHGGIALGLDRAIMILLQEPNIREVIAFPKTGDGRDMMMGAPAEVDKKQLKELHLDLKNKT